MRALLIIFALFGLAAPAAAQGTVPLEAWALRDTVTSVELSPDGKHLAVLRMVSRDGFPIIEIFDTANMAAPPRRLGADRVEFQGPITWVSDDLFILIAGNKVRDRIQGFNQGVREFIPVAYSMKDKEFTNITFPGVRSTDAFAVQVENVLPKEPNIVLISVPLSNAPGAADDPFAAFRPRAYYRYDLSSNRGTLVLRGNDRIATARFDDEGNPRFATGYDASTRQFVYYARNIGEDQWREIRRVDSFDLSTLDFVAFDSQNPNNAFVLANNGDDKIGLWRGDMRTGALTELLYRRTDADVAGLITHSNPWGEGSKVLGVAYFGAKFEREWFDGAEAEEEAALLAGLEQAIPNAHQVVVGSRSRDGETLVAINVGPKDPGSYWLLRNGNLSKIGSVNPTLKAEDLNEVRYIKYPSRDGTLTIPAYLTVPKGEPPYPLIVLPHGGPFVSEVINFDEWGQLLANNGYAVLQPQYRGSLGYGLKHFTSALDQAGLAMQDDKDDGALYLIQQGLVDKDRVAMFGWSYGGYAALVAASRTPNIYQCSIAGAAVADPDRQLAYYRDALLPAQEAFELRRRNGIQPVDEAAKVNIPLLLVHGDVDQRVPFEHMRIYTPLLDRARIPYRLVTLEGADHFSNTLYYEHQIELYTEMLKFFREECGPGGL